MIVNFFTSGYRRVGDLLCRAGLSARQQFVSTVSVVMTIQHAPQDRHLRALGIRLRFYIAILIGLVAFSFIGSLAGTLLFNR
ncbi:MAG: hypothetical protein ACXWYD_10780 [Candidatus Binatia bacterium]